jgi:hypothetical protein
MDPDTKSDISKVSSIMEKFLWNQNSADSNSFVTQFNLDQLDRKT